MQYYKDFDYTCIHNRLDLHYITYISALDFVVSDAGVLSLWAFCFDTAPGSHVYGRTIEELAEFLEMLQLGYKLSNKHKLVCYIDDLPQFFWRTHKYIRYEGDFISRNNRAVMLCNGLACIELRSFNEYYEQDIDYAIPLVSGIAHPEPPHGAISDICRLTDDDLAYIDNRISFISAIMRYDCDADYSGNINMIPLTKTARINRLFDNQKRAACNKSKCNINTMIMHANPLANEEQRKKILPLLKHAFFGGVNFCNKEYINDVLDNVVYGDFTSAYISAMMLKKYPLGKFEPLPLPKEPQALLNDPVYTRKALLITFEVPGLSLKKNAVPFLMSDMRHAWTKFDNQAECEDLAARSVKRRISESGLIRLTLTDIDFKLLLEHYTIKDSKMQILAVYGTRYGKLPTYILQVLHKLYSTKANAKDAYNAKKQAGIDTLQDKLQYEDIKSIPARVYGIFTKSPVVVKYKYTPDTQLVSVEDPNYISPNARYSSVLYQWGVWTTAHVRQELLQLRRSIIKSGSISYYGDTDSLAFKWTAAAAAVIAQYNEQTAANVAKVAEALGVDPHELRDLGSFSVDHFKYFKYTGTKQYCYVMATDAGLKFEFRAAGLNRSCTYFDDEGGDDPYTKMLLFSVNATIPAEYKPRKVVLYTPHTEQVTYTDRDGSTITRDVKSNVKTVYDAYTLGGSSIYNFSGTRSNLGSAIDNLSAYALKIGGFPVK